MSGDPFGKATEIHRLTKHPWNVGTVLAPLLQATEIRRLTKYPWNIGMVWTLLL